MEILKNEADYTVCVKPANMDSETQLPQALALRLGGSFFPVHRLDANVGGVMVYAKTAKAAAKMSLLMQNGEFQKEYVALCHGATPESGDWEDFLFKDSRKNKVFVVKKARAGVKKARLTFVRLRVAPFSEQIFPEKKIPASSQKNVALFGDAVSVQKESSRKEIAGEGSHGESALFGHAVSVQKESGGAFVSEASPEAFVSLARIRLYTGRSHQIRVQFASRGFPLLGDHKYGARDAAQAPFLYSFRLSFPWNGKTQVYESLPDWAK